MDRCMEVYRRSPDIDRVRTSIELLRWIGDSRILEWYPEIMQHDDAMESHPHASSASAASSFTTVRAFRGAVAEEAAATTPWPTVMVAQN